VAVLVAGLVVLRGGYLPQAFVVALLPFGALLIAGLVDSVWTAAPRGTPDVREATVWMARATAAVALVAALAVSVGPSWAKKDRALVTADDAAASRAADRWVATHVDKDSRLIVDDTMWVDLVRAGFHRKLGVVWFYKLDDANNLDPSVSRSLPDGWRDLDYIVSTPALRAGVRDFPGGLKPVRDALASSTVVKSFGSGPDLVEVRRIEAPAP
jgi:hypothetical protein